MRALTPNFTGLGFLVPFEVVTFRWAWGGLVCSVFSDQAQAALLAIVALSLVGSASGWAAILTAQAATRILLIVVGGVAADRLHLQAILRVGNLLQALALVSIAALDHIGLLSVPICTRSRSCMAPWPRSRPQLLTRLCRPCYRPS